MKKTFTVNINGIVFHIDEDAYHVLNDYLESIKQHFYRMKSGDEVISDIEARISEMLQESIGNEKQVITLDDIERIIKEIGQPSEFGIDTDEEKDWKETSTKEKASKRLYRDTDRSVLGGVCGGLGAYFHTDPVWFRLAFVILAIPGIGTPLLVYIVLWIVLPEARTATERLEMKGEKVNISNIEKSIREEIDHLKNKFNDFTREAKRSYKKKSDIHRSDIQGLGNALGRVIEVFVKIILVFVGIILLIIGISLILAFLAALFGFGHQVFIIDSELIYISLPALVDLILGHASSNVFFHTGLLLLLGIPIFMIFYGGVKLVFGLDRTKYVGVVAFYLWFAGLAMSTYYGFKVAKSFSQHGVSMEMVNIDTPDNEPVFLNLNKNSSFDRIYRYEDYYEIEEMNMILTTDEQNFFYGIPQLEIEKTNDDIVELEIYYRSMGKSNQDAETRAKKTVYSYSVNENLISFDPFFKIPENEIWREQRVDLVLKVPEGTYLQFSDDMYKIINDRSHSPYRLSGDTWKMTDVGLEETDILPVKPQEMEIEDEKNEIPDINSDDNEPVTLIGYLYHNMLRVLGFQA